MFLVEICSANFGLIRFATHKRHLSLYHIQLRDVLRTSVCPFWPIFPIPARDVKIARNAKLRKGFIVLMNPFICYILYYVQSDIFDKSKVVLKLPF